MVFIPLTRLPEPTREMIRRAVIWNLTPPSRGKGNRAMRRTGFPAIDTTGNHPKGMNAAQKAAWFKQTTE